MLVCTTINFTLVTPKYFSPILITSIKLDYQLMCAVMDEHNIPLSTQAG